MKIKQKKQILHDMFIQICMEEIDRQKHIAIGAPIPEIMSESEKSLSIYSKIPVLGGLALVGQAYNINQEQVFAQRINKAFAPFRNNNIKLLLSGAITEVINSIKTILDSYNDQQEIEIIAVLAYKKLFNFLKENDLNEEKLTINKIISIVQQQDSWFKKDIFYVYPNQEVIIEEFPTSPAIKKLKLDHEISENDDLILNSEHFRIDRIEQNIDQLQQTTQKQGYLLESIESITEIKELYFYNAKIVTYHFVGRDIQLNEIHEYFLENQNGIQVIGGLGGIGKTQIALQYINLYKSEYNNRVRCFAAETQESLEFEFKEFAQEIGISISHRSLEEIIQLVKTALESRIEHSLLVFDNLLDYQLLETYLPNTGAKNQHHIIITTQNVLDYSSISVSTNINVISLEELSNNEAYEYIKNNIKGDSKINAIKLSNLFDNIPLGLSQSVAFIKTNHLKIKDYLKEHQRIQDNNPKELPETLLHSKFDSHVNNIYITLSMSLKKIAEIKPKAFELLEICSYFNADKIPDYLFDILFENNNIEKSKVIAILEGYSLISLQEVGDINFIYLHRIVQEVIRAKIVNEDYSIIIKAMELAHQQLENNIDTVITLKKRQTLLQHSISLIDYYNRVTHKIIDLNKIAVRIYNDCGNIYFSLLQLDKAKEYYQQALQIGILVYGETSKQVATILCNIAAISQALKKSQDAIDQYENILSIYRAQEFIVPQEIAMIICKIAYSYLAMQKNELALSKYNEALVIYQTINTNDYIQNIADTINAIANVHLGSGKYQEAITQCNNALKTYIQLFGERSTKAAEVINTKGNIYRISGEYQASLEQYNLALEINKNIYGDQHLSVAINMRGICKIYSIMNRYDEALAMYELVLPIFEEVFNEEHLMVGKISYEIGNIYKAQNQNIKALEYFNKVLPIYQNTYGQEHRETVEILNNIDIIKAKLGQIQEASQIIKRAASIENKSSSQMQAGFIATLDWLEFIERIEDSQKSYHNSQESNIYFVTIHYDNPILNSSLFLYVIQNIKIKRAKIISALIEIGNDHEIANMLIEASKEYGEEYIIKLLFEPSLDGNILISDSINKINSFIAIKDTSECPGYVQYVHNAISNNRFSSLAKQTLDIISKLIDMLEDSLNISKILANENIVSSIIMQLGCMFDFVASGQNFLSLPPKPIFPYLPDYSFDGGSNGGDNISNFHNQDLPQDNQMHFFLLGDYNATLI